ncbi:MAG: hypothetical protein M3N54_09135 [Acidobacteriota bacterium]|nr:hypothetical protein [Acidobacteriota bacterium]
MAFRTKAPACAALMCLAALTLGATTQDYQVRHRHLRNGAPGVLRIDDNSISFQESGKQAKHSRTWKYDDIQELTLSADTLRVVTYEDNRRELGRDRVYVFDRLPAGLAADWYPRFRLKLDARFVAALADDPLPAEWQVPAKLLHGRTGSQGILLVGAASVVYKSAQPGESRTWRIADLENVSTSGEFDLTVNTHEREFRFQLKQPLAEAQYQTLWLRVNRARGLQILNTPG